MTSSPSPNNALTPPAIPTSLLDDDGDDGVVQLVGEPDDVAVAIAVTVDVTINEAVVAVDVTTIVAVSVLLGDVDPDVRLLITSPAPIENGDELPLVLTRQVLLNGFMLPQQNIDSLSTSTRYIPVP